MKAWKSVGVIIAVAFSFTLYVTATENPTTRGNKPAPQVGVKPEITNAFVPASSIERPEDIGMRAHTHYVLRSVNGVKPAAAANPNLTEAETPASMGCVYKVGPTYSGCNPATGGTRHPTGGYGAIALVDAYDNPYAAYSLSYFSSYWGLPAASFAQIYCTSKAANGGCYTSNTPPAANSNWGLEEALDIEWAHAMAPSATIYLVEAASNSYDDLTYAELWAGYYVSAAGGGEVSNSWGGGEFSSEANYESNFYHYYANTVYFASSGDNGAGAQYPAASPWVVAAGGTTVNRKTNGAFSSETCWAGAGGGSSAYLNSQGYQFVLTAGGKRDIPDIAFNADPNSGVWVYDYYNGGWYQVGGTSVASPALAGIANLSGNHLGQGTYFNAVGTGYLQNEEDYLIYSQMPAPLAYSKNFYDVKLGSNGYSATTLYDFCTGVGTPRGKLGK